MGLQKLGEHAIPKVGLNDDLNDLHRSASLAADHNIDEITGEVLGRSLCACHRLFRLRLKCANEGDDVAKIVLVEGGVSAFGGHGEPQHTVGLSRLAALFDELKQLLVGASGDELAFSQVGAQVGKAAAVGAVTGDAG